MNFTHYDLSKVNKIYALEPNLGMMGYADKERKKTSLAVEFIPMPGERIPLPDASVDTVVSTFTLCTIPGVADAIRGLRRVLKADGRFIFFEHGLAPDASVQVWQRRTEPLFRFAFEGCHVTRHVPSLIGDGGFHIEQLDSGYLAPFPKSGSHCWWGTAILKPS